MSIPGWHPELRVLGSPDTSMLTAESSPEHLYSASSLDCSVSLEALMETPAQMRQPRLVVLCYSTATSTNTQGFIHSLVFTTAAKGDTLSPPVAKEHKGRVAEEFELS